MSAPENWDEYGFRPSGPVIGTAKVAERPKRTPTERLVLPTRASTSLAIWFTALFSALTLAGLGVGWALGMLQANVLPAALAAWAIATLGYWLVSIRLAALHWELFEPLHQQIQKVATGDFNVPEPPAAAMAHPQVRTLAEGIRKLTDQLRGFHELGVEQLILEKAELEAVIFSMTEGLVIYDLDFNPVLTNPALRQIAQPGVHKTAFLEPRNLFLSRWADPEHIKEVERQMRAAPERPRVDIVELENPRQFLKRYSSPLFNQDRKQIGHLVIFHDVTTEIEADRMKSEFISNASHELRTPVTSMKVLVENVTDMMEDVHNMSDIARQNQFAEDFEELDKAIEAAKGHIRDVYAEANRMHQLVNDLLDVSKLNSKNAELNLQQLDAARVIEEAVATVLPQARQKEIEMKISMPGEIELVADRVRLRQILVNLLGNAVKYTQNTGEVLLAVQNLGDVWEFAVTDNGIGIPPEDLPHIFDRFFRVGRDRARVQGSGGSGLGLTIVKAAVQNHGGQIVAESEIGKGSTIRFTIPATLEATVPQAADAAPAEPRKAWLL
jgi:two-component system phosphate regulon sensor histidine kinase PhoR